MLVRTGRNESDVFAEVEHVVKQHGAETTYFMMSADPHPLAKFLDLAFDTYEKGDLVLFNVESPDREAITHNLCGPHP